MASDDELTKKLSKMKIDDGKIAIFCFARMNPPHKGHGKLITSMLGIQKSLEREKERPDVYIILQEKYDSDTILPNQKTDPMDFEARKTIITNYIQYSSRTSVGKNVKIISYDTAQKAFTYLKSLGYTRFYFMMGLDRREAFSATDYDTAGKFKNMYNHVFDEDFTWQSGDTSHLEKKGSSWPQNKFFHRKWIREYEIMLKAFKGEHLVTSYGEMKFPIVKPNSIIAVINPREVHNYVFAKVGEEIVYRDQKSISATEVRNLINNFQFTQSYDKLKALKPMQKAKMYDDIAPQAHFRDLRDLLLVQGELKGTRIQRQKELTFDMILDIKKAMSGDITKSFGVYLPAIAAVRKRADSKQPAYSRKEPKKINVLSYNVCWECSEPIQTDWNETTNWYEKDIQQGWAKRDAKDSKVQNLIDIYKGDAHHGLGFMCQKDVNKCRDNISSIIENSVFKDQYDLVAMQEYIPFHDERWAESDSFELIKDSIEQSIRHLNKDKQWEFTTDKNGKNLPKKTIHIASLYNKNIFTLLSHSIGEFKIKKSKKEDPNDVWKDGDEGRPFLILHLIHNNGQHILFINAHMPQTRNICEDCYQDASEWSVDKMPPFPKSNKTIGNTINEAIKSMKNIDKKKIRIILATDSNDAHDQFVKNIKILDKSLYSGDKSYEKTCCTTVVIPINKKGRKERRVRYGDIILDSGTSGFKYKYPEEKPNEPYSDHAPIAAQLDSVIFHQGGKRKKTRKCSRKRTKKKRKKRRRKRTKKKRKKRRRKRTKKGGGKFGKFIKKNYPNFKDKAITYGKMRLALLKRVPGQPFSTTPPL